MDVGSEFFQVTDDISTPFIIYDLKRIEQNYSDIAHAFPDAKLHYAVKCNAETRVLELIDGLGGNFEIASQSEAEQLIGLGVAPEKIICMHPIKSPEFLAYLQANRILTMAVDSHEEVEKIARYAPDSHLVIRIAVNNNGSLWNLNDKFGLDIAEVESIFQLIHSKHLTAYGITFQVGSQCETSQNWLNALRLCGKIWHHATAQGYQLQFLSLGGGLPAQYTRPVPSIADIGQQVTQEIRDLFQPYDNLVVAIEPGRSLVADAGILVTKVFGVATRGATKWVYIETGTYNGLIEAIETPERNFYPLAVRDTTRPHQKYHIGGPSCATLDTPFKNVELPELKVGDRLYILSAGAYTRVCATSFNGFPIPSIYYWQDVQAKSRETILSVESAS